MMPLSNSRVHVARWLETLAGAVASVLFPSGCRICEALLTRADRLAICDACLKSFREVPVRTAVGRRRRRGWRRACLQGVPRAGFAFDAARGLGIYDGALAPAIVLMKYARIEPLGAWLAKRLLEAARQIPPQFSADPVVPVPLHRTRQRERGFNQVDLFGRPLARKLGLPYRPDLLKRERARPEKHLLHFEERWDAVRAAFVIREGGRVDNSRILLLDDVMTSGAALDACSRALREAIGGWVDDRPGREARNPGQRKFLA